MWPLLLDMTKEESMQSLRCLELEAYAGLVSALRAQGPLNTEKMKLLKDTGSLLNISQDRHKAEVRRAVNDEKLNTIAYHVSGQKVTSDEWTQEGRRLIPLMPRVAPQTAYSAIADEVADSASKNNKLLPNPSNTERKRPTSMCNTVGMSDNKPISFRMPELPKLDDTKKRKLSIPIESSNLAQHLMGPPKMSKIQQIYRQKTKARQKELQLKAKQDQAKPDGSLMQQKLQPQQQQTQQKLSTTNQSDSSKVNILENISIPTTQIEDTEIKKEPVDITIAACKVSESNIISPQPGCSNENQAPKTKTTISCPKFNQHITLKHVASSPNGEKQIKVCGTRKNLATKCITTGQKLIVVSNPQSITTSSILHRTLSIPFVKNISVKNFDKLKIVTTNATPNIQLTTTSGQPTTTKHKVVTVRTNPTVKKVIPLSQLQVLNAKGSIKVLPLGGKIVTKTSTGTTPVYIVNSGNIQCITKSTTSTPIIMTCKTQDSTDNKSLLVLKNPDTTVKEAVDSSVQNDDLHIKEEFQEDKSNVLADIMEAVGVVPCGTDSFAEEVKIKNESIAESTSLIESIEKIKEELGPVKEEKTDLDGSRLFIQNINADNSETSLMNDSFICITEEEKSSEQSLSDVKMEQSFGDSSCDTGTLDPTTGLYTLTTVDNATCEPLNVEKLDTVINEPLEERLND
ncbi:hypothetical protein Trydic_g23023 [Trypoxylus dichotomus]